MEKFIHSVTLDKDLCKGCINCIKRCPTEAIRVRDGKAHILAERCIDCGECIRICPHHAKKPLYDPLTILDDFKYTIALPPPSLYGQYNNLEEQDVVLAALLDMGFDDVYEVAKAAELVSDATRRILQTGSIERPVIRFGLSGGDAAHPRALSTAHRPCAAAGRAHRAGRAPGQKRGRAQNRPAEGGHWLHFHHAVPGQGDGHPFAHRLVPQRGGWRGGHQGGVPASAGVHEAYLADGLSGQRPDASAGLGREPAARPRA